ncbi:MAG: hypothetical protein QNI91_01635 [Arenicellales bacterium]|nr:hypothetical protein [Arenicellales bacterium]
MTGIEFVIPACRYRESTCVAVRELFQMDSGSTSLRGASGRNDRITFGRAE